MLESKSLSHRGSVREVNEDSYFEDLAQGVWVVADGVGGNGNGQIASQLAVQSIERNIRQGMPLLECISEANDAIKSALASDEALSHMATTVVACRFDAGHFELSWVGDSRAYLINGDGMLQLSNDHNRASEMLAQGAIDESELASHPGQHELTQALGQMTLKRLPRYLGELHDGDSLLLCTDGLSGVVSDEELYQYIQNDAPLAEIAESLLDLVLERGAPDNVTFSLVRYRLDEPEIKARDFHQGKSYRLPFDRRPYEENCKKRPYLFVLILLVVVGLLVLI